MANALTKDLEIMFENYIEGYDAACVISMECDTSYPTPQSMQRAGDVFYRPQNYHANVVTGLDVSGATKTDVIQRMVPTVFRTPDNVVYQLDAKEMRDPEHMKQMGKAASTRLAANIDVNIYNTVAAQAGIVVKKVGALASSDVARAEALMLSRGIGAGRSRKLFLNPFDHVDITENLAGRQFMGDLTKGAYERSQVPDIAGFRTFRTDNVSNQTVTGTVTSTLVNGANQALTVTAMDGDLPADNRRMVLTCDGANVANVKAGDAFTLPTVNAVHQVDKSDTGQLMTFRVISNTAGALTITPAIITSGPYQNVTNSPADNAPLTFLNTVTKPVNAFWAQGAVALDYGKLAFPTDQGAKVATSTTKNGVPLIMSYEFDHLTGITTVRFTTLYATTVLDPEQCGIIIANQT
jgi:hypothetical protein